LGDKLYLDGEVKPEEIVEFTKKTNILPKTSAVNEHQFNEHFTKILENYDAIIHFSSSSEVSCAYQNAVQASKNFNNVFVVDTRCLCSGIAILAIRASQMVTRGYTLEEILAQVKIDIPKTSVTFILDKLDFLKKGGRCSSILCFGANLLKIHPQILMSKGFVTHGKKYRGNFDVCVKKYCEDTLAENTNINKDIGFVAYTTASNEAILTAKQFLENAGFKRVIVTQAGATITSHCGPNAIGILFINN
jgi:DegV family protein with EDD domain